MMRLALLVLLALSPMQLWAHKPSDSHLTLSVQAGHVDGRLDLALRDIEQAVGLDLDGDRNVTWGELRQRQDAVWGYVAARLHLSDGAGQRCLLDPGKYLVTQHSDGAYAALRFASTCPGATELTYDLLFDIDPLHRGLLQVRTDAGAASAVLAPDSRSYALASPSLLRTAVDFAAQGVWHVWIGFDHVLFLVLLILPAVVGRAGSLSLRAVLTDVVKIVTAFTVAHSITLSLATLGYLQLPSRWVESGIAASVVLAGINNIYPLLGRRQWAIAFGFGLIHGLGFASVLVDLGLPSGLLVASLLAFNVGVEAGQLSLIVVLLPVLFWCRDRRFYRRIVVPAGSAGAGLLGAVWLLERMA
jgi:hypothetical protein